ncbi:MAG TPA: BrnT family toxin [Allosphingosinicella sp.]
MKIEFDPAKRESILRRRGLDLATAGELLAARCLTEVDDRFDYGEDRWVSAGPLRGEIVVCVWTDRGDEIVRVITMWKATAREQERYFRWREGA